MGVRIGYPHMGVRKFTLGPPTKKHETNGRQDVTAAAATLVIKIVSVAVAINLLVGYWQGLS